MKLRFKERVFSWLDSYDVFNEAGDVVYCVKGELAWGHKLVISDMFGVEIAEVKEEVLTLLPKFHMLVKDEEIGMITKEFSFFKPKFKLTCNDWEVNGDIWEWSYVVDSAQGRIMSAEKEFFQWSDTYVMDIVEESNALYCLMIVLAIDAAKCSRDN